MWIVSREALEKTLAEKGEVNVYEFSPEYEEYTEYPESDYS